MNALTSAIFSGVIVVKGRPDGFFFSAETVAQKLDAQTFIVFLSGTESCRPSWNRMQNARRVEIAEPPLRIHSSTTNARCSPVHAIGSTKNGTYTAIDRYPLHGYTITTTHTAPSLNTGGFFAV